LDQEANTIPDNELDTTVTTKKSYPDLKQGVWYFHIKARGEKAGSPFGLTVHKKIGIDTEVPKLFDIKLVGQDDLNDVTRTPTVEFQGVDELSGIDHYDVYINKIKDGEPELVAENITSPYTFDKLESGPHLIWISAYDKAGNVRKSELPIIAAGGGSAPTLDFLFQSYPLPVYIILLMNFLILILMGVIIYLLLRKEKQRNSNDKVTQLQVEIDESLDQLKHQINQKLLRLSEMSTEELFEKEGKVAVEINSTVNKTKKTVDSKINKLKKSVVAKKE
jgi:hypothetical protein